jgi:D-glycero-D-manno-heptose 1,7-bisphosphate phosphatase
VRPAVFLDRDGTLLEEAGYVDRLERLVFFPYAVDAVRLLNRGGLAVVLFTNQSGVGRGIHTEAFVHEAHALVTSRLAVGRARLDGIYYCPHHPQAVVEPFRQVCECRKPRTGMLQQAAADLDLDLSRSFTVGDKWSDVEAGIAAGGRGILVRTGYGRSTEAAHDISGAAAVVDDLAAAAAWILRHA